MGFQRVESCDFSFAAFDFPFFFSAHMARERPQSQYDERNWSAKSSPCSRVLLLKRPE